MNIILISFSFNKGGAALAAKKFIDLLINNSSFDVHSLNVNLTDYGFLLMRLISFGLSKLQLNANPSKHSLNLFSYAPVISTLQSNFNIVHHLHWINNDTLSVFDFNKIPSGSIITLHDEWLYLGAEHIQDPLTEDKDFINGYSLFKKGVFGIHWNYIIWKIKFKKLSSRRDLIFTVPSSWMLERAKSSAILKNSLIELLPIPINIELFKPSTLMEDKKVKNELGVQSENFVFLFSANSKDKLKGSYHLKVALKLLSLKLPKDTLSKIVLIEFGGKKGLSIFNGFKIVSIGPVNNQIDLAKIYSLADCSVVPSLSESFGQVAAESLSCATPVISFNTSGLRDIVINYKNGLLAKSFSPESLSEKMKEVIEMPKTELKKMGIYGRFHISKNFSYDIISRKYYEILNTALQLKISTIMLCLYSIATPI